MTLIANDRKPVNRKHPVFNHEGHEVLIFFVFFVAYLN